VLFPGGRCYAQDPFEIHVYEYESLKPGAFTLESVRPHRLAPVNFEAGRLEFSPEGLFPPIRIVEGHVNDAREVGRDFKIAALKRTDARRSAGTRDRWRTIRLHPRWSTG
jgi:hypothetical protein